MTVSPLSVFAWILCARVHGVLGFQSLVLMFC